MCKTIVNKIQVVTFFKPWCSWLWWHVCQHYWQTDSITGKTRERAWQYCSYGRGGSGAPSRDGLLSSSTNFSEVWVCTFMSCNSYLVISGLIQNSSVSYKRLQTNICLRKVRLETPWGCWGFITSPMMLLLLMMLQLAVRTREGGTVSSLILPENAWKPIKISLAKHWSSRRTNSLISR